MVTKNKTRKRASRKPDLFALLFHNNPLPMLIYDLGTLRFLEANDAAVQYYGYSRAKFRKLHIGDISSSEVVTRINAFIRGKRQRLEYSGAGEYTRYDGSISFAEIASQKLSYRGHKAAWIMIRDVTESD